MSEILTAEIVRDAIDELGGIATPKALARHLRTSPEQQSQLREILRNLRMAGELDARPAPTARPVGKKPGSVLASEPPRDQAPEADVQALGRTELPAAGPAEVVAVDEDGRLFVRARRAEGLIGPRLELRLPRHGRFGGLGVGSLLLVRFEPQMGRHGGVQQWQAEAIRLLPRRTPRLLGVFHQSEDGPWMEVADKKARFDRRVDSDSLRQLKTAPREGDLVVAEDPLPTGYAPMRVKILEVIGRQDDPRAASILAIHAHAIPIGFSAEEEAELTKITPTKCAREDLRHLPLLTIDPDDARDHDDAVFAEPAADPKNPHGFRLVVAIADVAAYVRPGQALDAGARLRGNSTYFPDRVVPMLPEKLSADLCSLRENEDRLCFAVEIVLDAQGHVKKHRFFRATMRSAVKLSYEEAEAAFLGEPGERAQAWMQPALEPLWSAYQLLRQAREARAPLDLDSAERRVRLREGKVIEITPRIRLEAHRLIEEFMILANVCAAQTLLAKRAELIFRVHDSPSAEKIRSLTDFLPSVGMSWSKGETVTPKRFNHVLKLARETENNDVIQEMVLRSQAQAEYSAQNIGHFGLNLGQYAHFTSPIRRYADLIVHRALIRALDLGSDGLDDASLDQLDAIAESITKTERRSMAAERDATERYVAAFLRDRVGEEFAGRITGVTRFGAFIRLDETGADGLAPISGLGRERFRFDEGAFALIGERSGLRYQLGQKVQARLLEALPVTGGMTFAILSRPLPAPNRAIRRQSGVEHHGHPSAGRNERSGGFDAKSGAGRGGRGQSYPIGGKPRAKGKSKKR